TTCADTTGITFNLNDPENVKKHEALLEVCDLFLLDIKHIDADKHKILTGLSNERPLAFAKFLSDHGKRTWIRHVLVPGLTDDDESLQKLRSFIDTLSSVEKVEVLPYHTMGEVKYEKLGIPYPLKGVKPPVKERVMNAKRLLTE
ncbi:MAG: radical SAM protein, partial [Clostridia bacterium]|nr:radical SAM protein [Clostridia bacterium]